ncbi:Hypothetical predicted protein, partial [Olea europaea subsp. europaea]
SLNWACRGESASSSAQANKGHVPGDSLSKRHVLWAPALSGVKWSVDAVDQVRLSRKWLDLARSALKSLFV